MTPRPLRLLLAAALLIPAALPAQAPAQAASASPRAAPAAGTAALLARLAPAARGEGELLLAERDDAKRAALVKNMKAPAGAGSHEFLGLLLDVDGSAAVRTAIVNKIGSSASPEVRAALERRVTSDPDAAVSILALEKLRAQQQAALGDLVLQRTRKAQASGDAQQLALLAREQERYQTMARGGALPSFMQDPPPVFSLRPAGAPVRVLAFGDFGDGSDMQKEVAAAMRKYHQQRPFDFAITLGDNFYSKGMESPSDPRWKSWWSDLYDPVGIPFYASLGNHDWGFPDSPAAEILFSSMSPSWRMPAAYYTFTAGPVQFFALDTNVLSERQLQWLDEGLKESTARWKVVYAHHPVYSAGEHGDNPELIARLLPLLRGRADVYLAGHDHDMQHLQPDGSLNFFVAGSGGKLRPTEAGPRTLWSKSSTGFAVLDATENELTITFEDAGLNQLHQHTLRK